MRSMFFTDYYYNMWLRVARIWALFLSAFLQFVAYFVFGPWTLIYICIVLIQIYDLVKLSIAHSKLKYDKYGIITNGEKNENNQV